MTATWQGVLPPDAQQDSDEPGRGIVLRANGRRLLGELVRPYRMRIAGVLAVVLLQVAATMAGPWLVGVAIDDSLPAALHGHYGSLTAVGVSVCSNSVAAGAKPVQWPSSHSALFGL